AVEALRLIIGAIGAAHIRPFIPMQTEPAEAIEDWLQSFGDVALLVRIVDAQDELPTMPPGKEPVKERCAHAADMEIARWTGGEARTDHGLPSVNRKDNPFVLRRGHEVGKA